MAGKKLELDSTGRAVAANVAYLRGAIGLNYTELSMRLAKHNRDIPPLAVRRIEEGNRRVDVDDLTALALALEVSPTSLLMPDLETAGVADPVIVTGLTDGIAAHSVWIWLSGSGPLPGGRLLDFIRAFPRWTRDHMEAEAQRRAAFDGDD